MVSSTLRQTVVGLETLHPHDRDLNRCCLKCSVNWLKTVSISTRAVNYSMPTEKSWSFWLAAITHHMADLILYLILTSIPHSDVSCEKFSKTLIYMEKSHLISACDWQLQHLTWLTPHSNAFDMIIWTYFKVYSDCGIVIDNGYNESEWALVCDIRLMTTPDELNP